MIIKPMVRNNICLNSHPLGCAIATIQQIEFAKKNLQPKKGLTPKLALIIGCSNGYGLASRIAAAFGYGAASVGIGLEKPPSEKHTATPGFYNNQTFDRQASNAGLVSVTLNGDAFSDEMKADTVLAVRKAAEKANIHAKIGLIVYSLASPVRTDPKTGILHKSVIKPLGMPFSGISLNMMDGSMQPVNVEPATEEEVFNTVKVMGGEDWELWIETLDKNGLLSPNARTVAYTYIGPEHTWPIYKNGTIGKAKEDLERTAIKINRKYRDSKKIDGAWVSVNKALVTKSSAVIPVIPLYVSCLFKVMKEMGLHEGCIEQIVRLYRDRLYAAGSVNPIMIPVDKEGRIRIDDWEMREDVQEATAKKMLSVTSENVFTETDIAGFKQDFFAAHGFEIQGIDYSTGYNPLDCNPPDINPLDINRMEGVI